MDRSVVSVAIAVVLTGAVPAFSESESASAPQNSDTFIVQANDHAELNEKFCAANFVTGGYDKGYVRSSPFGAGATPEAINAAKTAMRAMKNEDAIFVGPITDNTGKLVVPAGTTYGPYADQLMQTNYLIEGVLGSIT